MLSRVRLDLGSFECLEPLPVPPLGLRQPSNAPRLDHIPVFRGQDHLVAGLGQPDEVPELEAGVGLIPRSPQRFVEHLLAELDNGRTGWFAFVPLVCGAAISSHRVPAMHRGGVSYQPTHCRALGRNGGPFEVEFECVPEGPTEVFDCLHSALCGAVALGVSHRRVLEDHLPHQSTADRPKESYQRRFLIISEDDALVAEGVDVLGHRANHQRQLFVIHSFVRHGMREDTAGDVVMHDNHR